MSALDKGTVFFYFPGIVRFFAFLRNIEWMNEKVVFFYFRFVFFFFPPKIWMNEWPKMTYELFRGKKKNKKHRKKCGKKKKQASFIKKIGTSSKSDWMTDELFLEKKKTSCIFFFPASRKKKKTRFSDLNEWMTNVHGRGKKKNTIPLPDVSIDFPYFQVMLRIKM